MTGRDAARDELAAILADHSYRGVQMTPLEAKQYANVLLSRGYRRSAAAAVVESEPQWEIRVRVPMRLDGDAREALFDRVAEAVHGWEPAERDGWDADVSAGPEQDQTRAFGLEVTE